MSADSRSLGPVFESADIAVELADFSAEARPLINRTTNPQGPVGLNKKNAAASLVNGTMYTSIAAAGGDNIRRLFHAEGSSMDGFVVFACVWSGVVYTMFMYKTFEAFSLNLDSPSKIFFSCLAPFAASAFLAAGVEGSKIIGFNEDVSIVIGLLLFLFRNINCIDAAGKFPDRLLEMKSAGLQAWREGDYAELSRLCVTAFVSLGFSASVTDAIFSAIAMIMIWFGANQEVANGSGYVSSILGAVGTLPLVLYWGFRGLRQLTFGGKPNASGVQVDPTDRYTYLALLLVLPSTLGVLGSAELSSGQVFGQLGTFSAVIRVLSSVLYILFAGTPGMASFLRNTVPLILARCSSVEETPLTIVDAGSGDSHQVSCLQRPGFFIRGNRPAMTNINRRIPDRIVPDSP